MHNSVVKNDPRPGPLTFDPSDRRLAAPPRSLLDAFAQTVAVHGERTAIDAPGCRLTYAELADAVQELAERLKGRGVGPGDRVGIRVASGTADLYVAILGALHAGAAYVPVDADDPDTRAASIWQGAEVSAVIGDGLEITELAPACGHDRDLTVADDAWVIFTSGSSGKPKGVAVSHRSAAAFVDAETHLWSVRPDDRVLAGLSVGFDASCEEMWLAWRSGAALVPAPRSLVRAAGDLGPWLAANRVSVVSTVPTLAAMWDEADLAGVRLLIFGGEACPDALAWRLANDREVWNTYGPTEATVVATAARLRPGKPVTIGWPLHGWEIAIIDERDEPVALGEPGELVIGGVGLARYLDPALDGERYAPLTTLGWHRAYRTGDIVRETVDGLAFIGRRDDQVKLGGRRLELGEIDAQLNALPGVRAAASAAQKTAAGNPVLVGYVVGDVDLALARHELGERLPKGIVPLLITLDELPMGTSGKVSRKALPWPPPSQTTSADASTVGLDATQAWLAERWAEQLGPLPMTAETNFFELGGSSLAAAKLVSALRARFAAVAVADVYNYPSLGELAARLDTIAPATDVDADRDANAGTRAKATSPSPRSSRLESGMQLLGVFAMIVTTIPQWLIGLLAIGHLQGVGPQVGWGWLIGAWVTLASPFSHLLSVAGARRLLLRGLRPGRYPRRGPVGRRVWFVQRLMESANLDSAAGTPWAVRYARILGHKVGHDAKLGTLPSATARVSIGDGATIESDVDMNGWWIEGDELVVGEVTVGAGARVGTRSLLMAGSVVGDGAEVDPGSVIDGTVPAGERWSGAPAALVGPGGELWPTGAPPAEPRRGFWRVMYIVGFALQSLLPLLASAPGIVLVLLTATGSSWNSFLWQMIVLSPVLALSFTVLYAGLMALIARAVGWLIRPGWQSGAGATGWALWMTGSLISTSQGSLFPLYATVFTRPWLRLFGVQIGRKTEISTAHGISHLTSFGEKSFAADDILCATARSRDGWLHVAPVTVGDGCFLGNGAILQGDTALADATTVGAMTVPPHRGAPGATWLGSPALEFPRTPRTVDASRTTNPPRSLVIARGAVEVVRILFPATVSTVLGALVVMAIVAAGSAGGVWGMVAVTPWALIGAGIIAAAITVAVKWLLMGRYRAGEHPFWSSVVWRDEIINTCQEQLAGAWLLDNALATPLMSVYLRLMGARVGRDVWCETKCITEFEMVTLGDGCALNRSSVVETHLFHDRLFQIGTGTVGAGATLGPFSAMLPETELGGGCTVGGRSIVMRGESLPPCTRWHGAPVVSA